MCLGCDEGLDENDLKAAFMAINQWSSNQITTEPNSDKEPSKKKSICPPPPYFWKLKCNVLCFECDKFSIGINHTSSNKNVSDTEIPSLSLKRTIDEVVDSSVADKIPEMDLHDYWDFL